MGSKSLKKTNHIDNIGFEFQSSLYLWRTERRTQFNDSVDKTKVKKKILLTSIKGLNTVNRIEIQDKNKITKYWSHSQNGLWVNM